jgi:uncharacterized membrane protein
VTIPRRLASLWHDRRGSVAVLVALSMTFILGVTVLVVDFGSVFFESRRLQGGADAAALAAAASPSAADSAALSTIGAMRWRGPVARTVVRGLYTPDSRITVAARFTAGGTRTNAARVTLVEQVPTFFGKLFGLQTIQIRRTATAMQVDMAAFSIGSRLAAIDLGIANQLLSGLAGTRINLTAADYNALLNADVDALKFASALRTQLGLTAATYEQALAATATMPQILQALANGLTASGQPGAAAAIVKLQAVVPATQTTLSGVLNLGALGKQDRAVSDTVLSLNAFSVLQNLLQVGGGRRQVALDFGSTITGLTGVTAVLALGERQADSPWVTFTDRGEPIVRTAQSRLYLKVQLPGGLGLLLFGIAEISLPIYVELAEAQARLSSISCTASGRSVTLQVAPSLGHASIADIATGSLSDMTVAPAENRATLVNILGIKITALARLNLSSGGWQNVPFNEGEIASRATKTVTASGAVSALATSLISTLDLDVTIGGVTLKLSPILTALRPVLLLVAPIIDGLLQTLFGALGINLGQADVRINGVRCGTAVLVA